MYKFLIADDHPLFREALIHVINTSLSTPEILEAGSFDEALKFAIEHEDTDLILLDINMPGMNGLDGLYHLRQQAPTIPIAIISADEEKQTVLQAMDQGAVGFIAKSSSRYEMSHAIELILQGEVYLPASIMRQPTTTPLAKAKVKLPLEQLYSLTRKQLLVLQRMVEGDSNKQIAAHLNIAETTVKAHVSAILSKLDAQNRVQAILAASEVDFSQLIRR
ncbi:MAG: DNA-binding response regulator [Oceanospirillales bacterium]|nr:MAG: DNA-binding response regulator [Oceanospirillales bacterium]